MRKVLALLAVFTSLALVCPVLAQPAPGAGGGTAPEGGVSPRMRRSAARGQIAGAAGALMRLYDPKTVTTVQGAVESLGDTGAEPRTGSLPMRTAVLKVGAKDKITLYLAPDWFLDQQNASLKVGDKLEVTGSKITTAEQPATIVREFKVGGRTIVLRNDKGIPEWLGQRPPATPAK